MPTTPKLRYSAEYIRGLIRVKGQDTLIDTDRIVDPNDPSGGFIDIDDYHVSGLIFSLKAGVTDKFTLWKVLSKTPTGPFNSTTEVDMFFVEVAEPSSGSGATSWWEASNVSTNEGVCLSIAPLATVPTNGVRSFFTEDKFDFAYFDSMSIMMQCQGSDGIFISGAFVGLGRMYFRNQPYNSAESLKSERIFSGASTMTCIDDIGPLEDLGKISDKDQTVYASNAPHVLLGVPCPPFWAILSQASNGEQLADLIGGGSANGAAIISYKGTSLRIAYGLIRFISNLFGLANNEYSYLYNQTIDSYFQTRTIIESGIADKFLAERTRTRLETTYLGMERLRVILRDDKADETWFVISSGRGNSNGSFSSK